MGGNAFAHAVCGTSPTLSTPRMSPERYQQLKKLYGSKLNECLAPHKVSILIEAPEKKDYGDLDFIVESGDEPVDWHHVAKQMGAAGLITHSSAKVQSCSLAVPIDGSASATFNIYKHKHNLADLGTDATTEQYAQIDLEVVPRELFDWHSFYSSYGDMSGMLGHMVHNLGFTVCDKGLMLRLVALDAAKDVKSVNIPDKSGKLFLSKDPQKVLEFLGMSYDTYKQRFTGVEALYRWLSQCRLLCTESIKVKRDDASARQKEAKRTLYSTFFNDWLPARFVSCSSSASESDHQPEQQDVGTRRADLAAEAAAFFDRETEYEQMNTTLVREVQSQTVDNLMKPLITQYSGSKDTKRAEILRGFRRFVGFGDEGPYVLSTPHEDQQSELYKFLDKEDTTKLQDETFVSQWVKENWELVKGLERERGKLSKLPT